MSRTLDALKNLGKKCNKAGTAPTGNTTDEVLNSIATSFDIDGADGASVKTITLYTGEGGAITGGLATLTDDTEIEITVTTAPET